MATWGEYLWSWVTWGTSFVSSPAADEPAPSDPLDDQQLPDDQTVAQPEAEDQLTEDGFLPANEDDTVAGTSSGANLDHLLTSPQKSRPKRSLQKPPSVAHIRSRKDLRSEPSVTPEPKVPRLGPSMPGAAGPRPVLFDPSAVRLRSSPASSPTSSSSNTDDRFADTKLVDRYAYLPFGDGPRICIGANFALQEAVIILATLLARFRFDLVPGKAPKPVMILTLRPEGGVWLKVTPA